MIKYVHKHSLYPVIQYTGNNWRDCMNYVEGKEIDFPSDWNSTYEYIEVPTISGTERCYVGDYIFKNADNRFFIITEDYFNEWYIPVEEVN